MRRFGGQLPTCEYSNRERWSSLGVMGFRDEAEAARARIVLLEQELETLRAQNAELSRRREQTPASLEEPGAATPADAGIPRLVARAYVPVAALWGALLGATALCWAAGYQLLPPGLSPAVGPVILGLLALALASVLVALWLGAKPIQTSAGWDSTMMGYALWIWLPFALLVPVAGQVMALVRAALLCLGRLGGATVTTTRGGTRSSRTYPDARLRRGEGRPAGLAYLALGLGWPALLVSMASTGLGSKAALFDTVHRTGRVTAVSGTAPAEVEEACTLRVDSRFLWDQNCRIEVRCGQRPLYGGEGLGYNECLLQDGVPVSAEDARDTAHEGDPKLSLDLPSGQVVVSDDAPVRYVLTITLDPPTMTR